MTIRNIGCAALGAALGLAFAAPSQAAPAPRRYVDYGPVVYVRVMPYQPVMHDFTGIGQFVVSPGDSPALIRRSYPNDANPQSLAQTYNLRGRMMNEFRN